MGRNYNVSKSLPSITGDLYLPVPQVQDVNRVLAYLSSSYMYLQSFVVLLIFYRFVCDDLTSLRNPDFHQ